MEDSFDAMRTETLDLNTYRLYSDGKAVCRNRIVGGKNLFGRNFSYTWKYQSAYWCKLSEKCVDLIFKLPLGTRDDSSWEHFPHLLWTLLSRSRQPEMDGGFIEIQNGL